MSIAGRWAAKLSPLLGLAAAVVLFYAIPPHVGISAWDARAVALHAVIVGTAACGMALVIVNGGIDLSVGSMVSLTSIVAAVAMKEHGGNAAMALAAACCAGALCGAYNGALVTGLRLPAFVATLGTLGLYRGVAKWISGSIPVSAPTGALEGWVRAEPRPAWLVVAPAVWVMLGAAAVVSWVLRSTVFGRRVVAMGDNEEAARRAGVAMTRTRIGAYAACGLFAGLAGVVQFARLGQGDPTVAVGLELDVVAAVVIGGASLSGGHVSIAGAVTGAVLMAFLRNRCTVLGWPTFVQEMAVGHIIIGAVVVDRWRRRR